MLERTFEREESIDSSKKEIINSLEHKQKSKKVSKRSGILVTAILTILTLVSVAQTVQSATILDKVDNIKSSGVSSAALPSSLEDLPDMVGGC